MTSVQPVNESSEETKIYCRNCGEEVEEVGGKILIGSEESPIRAKYKHSKAGGGRVCLWQNMKDDQVISENWFNG